MTATSPRRVASLMAAIADTGRDASRGGYTRPVYSTAELDLRSWFVAEAETRGLDVETDRNGVIWAWWDAPSGDRSRAIVTGSHLDSVPGGGAFDGPAFGVDVIAAAVDGNAQRADLDDAVHVAQQLAILKGKGIAPGAGPVPTLAGVADAQQNRLAAFAQHVVDAPDRLVQAADQSFALGAEAVADALADLAEAADPDHGVVRFG